MKILRKKSFDKQTLIEIGMSEMEAIYNDDENYIKKNEKLECIWKKVVDLNRYRYLLRSIWYNFIQNS